MEWNKWVIIAMGAWLIVSPWVLGFSSINLAVWNVIISGIAVILAVFWDVGKPGSE